MGYLRDLPLAGRIVGTDYQNWTAGLRTEFARNEFNGHVGGRLLDQSRWARVWEIRLDPGARLPAHRHVLTYSWTALTAGHSRQHVHDGTTRIVSYEAGESRYLEFGHGQFLVHDLANIGATPLTFLTVEFLGGPNAPLPL